MNGRYPDTEHPVLCSERGDIAALSYHALSFHAAEAHVIDQTHLLIEVGVTGQSGRRPGFESAWTYGS